MFAALSCAAALLAACAGGSPEPLSASPVAESTLAEQPASIIQARGKLRDLTAAVNRALDTRGLAVLHVTSDPVASTRTYELVGIRGESGALVARFEDPGTDLVALRTPRDITLTARLGVLGDAQRQSDLLRAVAGELELLASRER